MASTHICICRFLICLKHNQQILLSVESLIYMLKLHNFKVQKRRVCILDALQSHLKFDRTWRFQKAISSKFYLELPVWFPGTE